MVVTDTSVAFKWFDEGEKYSDVAKLLLVQHLKKQEEISVPDLFLYEITNAWSTKTLMTASDVNDNLLTLKRYMLDVSPINFDLLNKANIFSKQYRVSVYDASYAVLAEEKNCDLITADEKFFRQVKLPFVKLLKNL